MEIEGIKYVYVHRFDNPTLRGLWYIIYSLFFCLFRRSVVFIVYFKHCDLFPRLLPRKRFHVDIRTLSVSTNETINKRNDNQLRNSIKYFKSISYISNGVKDKMAIEGIKQYILPLGADIISGSSKKWTDLKLLYVGTLTHRDILKTVQGLKMYIDKTGSDKITYDIVGDGDDKATIEDYVRNNNLASIVRIHGRIAYDKLWPYFDCCNVGVSFVPIEECYQNQPPTKTFEYILSGMYCIATKTFANEEVITNTNGVLIKDTAEDFYKSLVWITQQSSAFDSKTIRQSLLECYSWRAIVNNQLIPIIENL